MQEMIKSKNNAFANFLIFLGVAMIIVTVFYSFLIFTAKKSAPQVFLENIPIEENYQDSKINQNMSIDEMQRNISQELNKQVKSVFYEFAPKMLNLFSWSIFAWIAIGAGAKISNIGREML